MSVDEYGIARTPRTIAELPFFAAGRFPKPDLIGRCLGGQITHMSGRELVDAVRDASLGLAGRGMKRGDRIALLSENRPEWLIVDFAVLTAGAVTVPIYPTLSPDQVSFILKDSGASMVVVSSAAQLAKVIEATASVPSVRTIVMLDPLPADATGPVDLVSLADISAEGHRRILDAWGVGREFQETARSIQPGDLATIIYTSGTTGEPKGVMLSHGNLASNVEGVLEVLDLTQDDTALSFLPLCHAFERTVSYVCLASGVSLIFAESIDTIARDLTIVRPTVMSCVPRVFEKLYARVLEKGRQNRGVKRAVFEWAMGVARDRGHRLARGAALPWTLRVASGVAERQVFVKIREGIGGRLRWAVSGSAPLNIEIAEFFLGIGLPILEGYGLTETAPVISVMPVGRIRFGTVGPPLPNVEVKIALDGEVLARGPNVMLGYYNRPEDTAAAMPGGWFHTGDIGNLDEAGYIRITDRKKELLVTSGGKKIAPQPIEERLRTAPIVNDVMLIGDRRHFPAALFTPDYRELAARLSVDIATARTRAATPEVHALFQAVVDDVNSQLAQFEKIKKFCVLATEFSVATGELTPTLKLKRRVVLDKYAEVIETIYR
jgi:long-chain acyl-CoA synthetase